jgi:CrcB protein
LETPFPYGTLTVNILGCFLIGVVFGIADRGTISPEWRLFLATGVIGGFTTFSAFSYETITLLRSGHLGFALFYVTASVCVGLIATYTGLLTNRWIYGNRIPL